MSQEEVEATSAEEWHPLFTHPLFQDGMFRSERISWREFMKRWVETKEARLLIELLHVGFDEWIVVNDIKEVRQRICFYLEVAYGYQAYSLFPGRSTYSYMFDPEIQSELALKAWGILCLKVFTDTRKKHERSRGNPSWFKLMEDEVILERILWFFSNKDNIPDERKFENNHKARLCVEFLRRLAKCGWEKYTDRNGYQENPPPCFIKARPQFIEILSDLGELDFLISASRGSVADLKTLKRLAMDSDCWLYNDGRGEISWEPETIEDSLCASNQRSKVAARVYIILELTKRKRAERKQIKWAEWKKEQEKVHQQKIEKAEKSAKRAQDRLESLKTGG